MQKALITVLVVLAGSLYAQFTEVSVQTDVQRLNDRERQDLQGLEEAIQQFYISSPWEQDIADLEMYLDVQLVFQSTLDIGNEVYYQAFDILAGEKPDSTELRKALGQFYKSIQTVVKREGQERQTSIFLSGHVEEIAEMLALAGMWDELADMRVLNPDGERIYQNYLESKNEGQ